MAQARSPEVPFIFVSGVLGEEWPSRCSMRGHGLCPQTEIVQTWSAVHRALSEVEERARRRKAELETTFRSLLLDNATDSIFVIGLDGKVIYANKRPMRREGTAKRNSSVWGRKS